MLARPAAAWRRSGDPRRSSLPVPRCYSLAGLGEAAPVEVPNCSYRGAGCHLAAALLHPASQPDLSVRSGPSYRDFGPAVQFLTAGLRRQFPRRPLRPARRPTRPLRCLAGSAGVQAGSVHRKVLGSAGPVPEPCCSFASLNCTARPRRGFFGKSRGSTAPAAAMSRSRSRHEVISLPVTGLSNGSMRLSIGAGKCDLATRAGSTRRLSTSTPSLTT